jgi:hypothetical protein
MTTPHRCDPGDNRLSMTRVLRLLQMQLDDGIDLASACLPVFTEMSGCIDCLTRAILGMTGMASSALQTEPHTRAELVADLDFRLAALLDEIEDGAE